MPQREIAKILHPSLQKDVIEHKKERKVSLNSLYFEQRKAATVSDDRYILALWSYFADTDFVELFPAWHSSCAPLVFSYDLQQGAIIVVDQAQAKQTSLALLSLNQELAPVLDIDAFLRTGNLSALEVEEETAMRTIKGLKRCCFICLRRFLVRRTLVCR